MYKALSVFLIIVIMCNFIIFAAANFSPAEAGFWDDNKEGIMTVAKGLLMLWIMNLIRENIADDNDDIISSTIKKGLNIGDEEIPSNISLNDMEQDMLMMINKARGDKGIASLQIDHRLTKIARDKARDIIENDYFAHQSPVHGSIFDVLKAEGVNYLLAGENLARASTIQKAFDGLMQSSEHRANIMDERYDRIGVGIIKESEGVLTAVQVFIDSPDLLK